MRRRDVLQVIACAIAVAPKTVGAQTAAKTYRIGTLTVGPPIPPTEGTGKMLVEGLAKRGYKLGENLAYEARGAAGKIPQMPNLMQDLKAASVDVAVRRQYENRKGDELHDAEQCAFARRRGDRISPMSAFGGKADINQR
jgi:putative tryptophan/tyrosine transport system substrate-binding protein